jgi:hypothetical protein
MRAKRLRIGVLFLLHPITALAPATAVASNISDQRLIGCWSVLRTIESPVGHHHPGAVNVSSSIRCYRPDGYVTGATFDHGHGWDWSYLYRTYGTAMVRDYIVSDDNLVRYHFRLAGQRLIMTDQDGTQISWSLLCRTETQDVQCGRLTQKLSR